MKFARTLTIALAMVISLANTLFAQNPEFLTAQPLEQVVKPELKPVKNERRVPVITWGADVATIAAQVNGIFKAEGFGDAELFCENDFAKQVAGCLAGESAYLRGTLGMINAAAPVFAKAGSGLVVIYQLSWSTGGDTIVGREGVRGIPDLTGKTIVVQVYGPHCDYVAVLLDNASIDVNSVTFKWVKELTLPTTDTGGKLVDPVSVFQKGIGDAVTCIIPDALNLTSKGTVGTGTEGSVKGARIISTTKTNDRVIADVYAVRLDYFQANRGKVEAFVRSLLKGQESLADLQSKKDSQQAKYRQLMAKASELIWGAAEAVGETEALLGDCTFAGHGGNVAFFTGAGTTRNLERMTEQIQTQFLKMGLMSGRAPVGNASWDWAALGKGLANLGVADAKPRFDERKTQAAVEQMIEAELGSWESAATLFTREVFFPPKSTDFDASSYAPMYEEIVGLAQTNSGAIIVIEGHADPLGILKAQRDGKTEVEINMIRQTVKNISLERAQAVREAFLAYCKQKGHKVDPSQFVAVGMGVQTPKFPRPKNQQEWNENRRAVFRVKTVEAELEKFEVVEEKGK